METISCLSRSFIKTKVLVLRPDHPFGIFTEVDTPKGCALLVGFDRSVGAGRVGSSGDLPAVTVKVYVLQGDDIGVSSWKATLAEGQSLADGLAAKDIRPKATQRAWPDRLANATSRWFAGLFTRTPSVLAGTEGSEPTSIATKCAVCKKGGRVGVTTWQCGGCDAAPTVGVCSECIVAAGHKNEASLDEVTGVRHPTNLRGVDEAATTSHKFTRMAYTPRAISDAWLAAPHPPSPPSAPAPVTALADTKRPALVSALIEGSMHAVMSAGCVVADPSGVAGRAPLLLSCLHVVQDMAKALAPEKGLIMARMGKGIASVKEEGGKWIGAMKTASVYTPAAAGSWMAEDPRYQGPGVGVPIAMSGWDGPRYDMYMPDMDVVAFRLGGNAATTLRPIPLAPSPPAVGAPAWLIAHNPSGDNKEEVGAIPLSFVADTTSARVVRVMTDAPMPSGVSGSPIVDGAGRLLSFVQNVWTRDDTSFILGPRAETLARLLGRR
jgi:hypothetical protein